MGTLPGWNVEGFVAVPRVYPTLIAAATTNWNTKSYNAWLDSIIYMMHPPSPHALLRNLKM